MIHMRPIFLQWVSHRCLLTQEPADLSKQFPDLAEDFHLPQFFGPDQFFSSVFRISSRGLQLWTHYDVSVPPGVSLPICVCVLL